MLKKIAAFAAVIVLVLSTFIISGSAANDPIYTQTIEYGKSYVIVYDTLISQYKFVEYLTGNPGNFEIVKYTDGEDSISSPILRGGNKFVDVWVDQLGLFIEVPIEIKNIVETCTYTCDVTVSYQPGTFYNAYVFTIRAFAVSYEEYFLDANERFFGLVFDDHNALTTTPSVYLWANISSDHDSFAYYSGMVNASSQLREQYQLGYEQGLASRDFSDSEIYQEGKRAGFEQANIQVTEKNVVAGFLQGTWWGITQFFSIFLNGATIFGETTILTALTTGIVIFIVYAVIKKVF